MHLTLAKALADAVRPGMEVLYHQRTLGHGAGLENQPKAVRWMCLNRTMFWLLLSRECMHGLNLRVQI